MQVVYERCCGLDIHKRTVVACIIVPGPVRSTGQGHIHKEVRSFGTIGFPLFTEGVMFLFMTIVLIVKPSGLFGKER